MELLRGEGSVCLLYRPGGEIEHRTDVPLVHFRPEADFIVVNSYDLEARIQKVFQTLFKCQHPELHGDDRLKTFNIVFLEDTAQ